MDPIALLIIENLGKEVLRLRQQNSSLRVSLDAKRHELRSIKAAAGVQENPNCYGMTPTD